MVSTHGDGYVYVMCSREGKSERRERGRWREVRVWNFIVKLR